MTSLALGPITLGHFLSVGAILFALSVIGIFLNPSQQVRVTKAQRLRIVRMKPTVPAPQATPGAAP